MVRPRESNPRPPALQSNALPTNLILPRISELATRVTDAKQLFFYLSRGKYETDQFMARANTQKKVMPL